MEIFNSPTPEIISNSSGHIIDEKKLVASLTHIYHQEQSEFIKNTTEKTSTVIPVTVVDYDDDNFILKDMYNKTINSIKGYKTSDTAIVESNISFPANKEDYSELYNTKGYIARVVVEYNKPFKYFNYFNKDNKYKLFNKVVKNRYETKINISSGCVISPISAKVKEINDSAIVFDDDNSTTVNVDSKYICVKVGDEIKTGDLLEKKYEVYYDINKSAIVINNKINNQLKEFYLPIDKTEIQ